MRRLIAFASEGNRLIGTLDLPKTPARVGVLIVSGGNEVRTGAHRGQALLAAALAEAGVPVMRFDRAGVGDSTGDNIGFAGSLTDIRNAALILRTESQLEAIVGLGNCDAATALARFGRRSGVDAVVLTNPWLRDEADLLPPTAAIRARYLGKLRRPTEWLRLIGGKVDLHKLARGVNKLLHRPALPSPGTLDAIAAWQDDATVVLASGDATALAFAAAAGHRLRPVVLTTASHSFAGEATRAALATIILDRVGAVAASLKTATPPPVPTR